MGFLDDIKATAKTELGSAKKALHVAKLKSELDDLKKLETEAYAAVGRAAAAEAGLAKFGEDGAKVISIQEKIAAKQAEIDAEETKEE